MYVGERMGMTVSPVPASSGPGAGQGAAPLMKQRQSALHLDSQHTLFTVRTVGLAGDSGVRARVYTVPSLAENPEQNVRHCRSPELLSHGRPQDLSHPGQPPTDLLPHLLKNCH